ncbi:molybdopterin cofactor-binding domain-containing protein [Sphaerisporangium fuscum]|uniref:molybdopterin cofactor-binding domain-containing protein n=1 Tax=Sphaerisporangium fuscum TaxID=2835868 RepID=UPI001BDC9049|nr:molybdopterin cofactor-binding domain-containing protein [Sphaerisporangium fuscum]
MGSAVLQAARELRRTDGGPLSVEGRFAPRQSDPITPGIPHAAFASSAQIVLVEVDTLTGEVDVLRVEHYLDAGRVIDRAGVEAQSEGAIAQGLGLALLEDAIIEDGEPRTTRLSTYLIPSALDVPADIVTFIVEEPEPLSPLGVRGIGEIGISATAAAVANAIYDARRQEIRPLPHHSGTGTGSSQLMTAIELTINGAGHQVTTDPRTLLLHVLREELGLPVAQTTTDHNRVCPQASSYDLCKSPGDTHLNEKSR